jgi:hypothetical protein
MADVRVKLNMKGIRTLLKSDPVQSDLARRAARGAATAPDALESVVKPHRYTARAFVQTKDSAEARRREANDKVLIRALDAMR